MLSSFWGKNGEGASGGNEWIQSSLEHIVVSKVSKYRLQDELPFICIRKQRDNYFYFCFAHKRKAERVSSNDV